MTGAVRAASISSGHDQTEAFCSCEMISSSSFSEYQANLAEMEGAMRSSKRYVSVAQAARELGVSEKTVRRRLKDEVLPSWQPAGPGTHVFIPIEALDYALVTVVDDVPSGA